VIVLHDAKRMLLDPLPAPLPGARSASVVASVVAGVAGAAR